ncbi:MAG: DUF2299 family protein [Candidatus Lokiarchaeota archaeon]|nr:DUF2299 family protein [Candidatus Lokiarchaeota archaeon]
MTIDINKAEKIIQEYLLDEEILRKKLKNPKIDFGFQFSFPPGSKGHPMSLTKPKGKDFLLISVGIQISPPYIKALDSLKDNKKTLFFKELRKFIIFKNMFFRIDIQNHRYELFDQIFIKKDSTISKNSLYKRIRYLFNCTQYSNLMLDDFCSGQVKHEDVKRTMGTDYSFYT